MIYVDLVEVYESPTWHDGTRLTNDKYCLRQVIINPDFVAAVRENTMLEEQLQSGHFPEHLDARQKFTKLQMSLGSGQSSVTINVVGDIETIIEKLTHG